MNAPTTTHSGIQNKTGIFKALNDYDLPTIREFQKKVQPPNLSHIPSDRGLPVIGHIHHFLTNYHGWLNKQEKKHGLVFRLKTPQGEVLFLLGPDANKLVLKNEHKIFSNFLAWDVPFNSLFDNNLLERDFGDHKATRKILQAAFKRPAVTSHIELMGPIIKDGVLQIQTDVPIKAMKFLKALLLSTGAEVFLGAGIDSGKDRINSAFEKIVAGTTDPFRRKEIWFSPYAKGVKGNKIVSDYIFKSIPERRGNDGKDIFSHFCNVTDDEGNSFTDEEIRDHIIFVLFAAHDTTTSALSSILYSLATHLDWQQIVREEMQSIKKENLAFEDMELLVKTSWVFKEALRMYPPLAMFPRFALEPFEYGGYKIPANTPVAVSPVFTHYMEEYWSSPYSFDPNRFSPERAEEKGDFYQYIPFGGGSHKCLGLHFAEVQAKIVLFHLLKNYRFEKNGKMTKYRYNNIPLTFPSDGLPLTFHRI